MSAIVSAPASKQRSKKLGYSPDLAARSLASAGMLRIGLLYGNPSATFNSEFLVELLEESGRIGCQLIVEKCLGSRNPRAAARRLIKKRVDVVLLPTPLCDALPLLRYFETAGVVYVSVGTGREELPGLSLRIDNARAAEDLHVANILQAGHAGGIFFPQYDWNPVSSDKDSTYSVVPGQEDPQTSRRGHTID